MNNFQNKRPFFTGSCYSFCGAWPSDTFNSNWHGESAVLGNGTFFPIIMSFQNYWVQCQPWKSLRVFLSHKMPASANISRFKTGNPMKFAVFCSCFFPTCASSRPTKKKIEKSLWNTLNISSIKSTWDYDLQTSWMSGNIQKFWEISLNTHKNGITIKTPVQ